MIKNEREYRITKAQEKAFSAALDRLLAAPADPAIHPRLAQAEVEALRSQLQELRDELRAYDDLRQHTSKLTITSFSELPTALIKARIAAGISQKELAQKIGVAEQQIQRYEANGYKGASLERVNEIINALKLRVHKDVFLPTTTSSADALFTRAQELGIDKDFLLTKLLTPDDRSVIEHAVTFADDESFAVRSAASTLDRIFDLAPGGFLASTPPTLNLGAPQFKAPAHLSKRFIGYTAYAYYLAKIVRLAHDSPQQRPPTDPAELRDAITTVYGELTLHSALHYAWDLGIPVLPLNYPGTFHGACWREEYQHVIVLKQRTPSAARWLNDFFHELRHTTQRPDENNFAVIETGDSPLERAQTSDERDATEFASAVILHGREEELAELAVEEAKGKVEWLKQAAVRVAEREHVDVGALANYLAYRLAQQGINWWGTATNLQRRDEQPFDIARAVFCQRMNFSRLTGLDQTLLNQALR